MSEELHLTPWEIDAADAAMAHNLSGVEAINTVILDWLSRGDTKPFYDWILCGHQPSPIVLQAVAYMMMRGDPDCTFDPAKTSNPELADLMPFALVVKGGKSGRRGNAWRRTRDARIGAAVSREMERGLSYDAAVKTVHDRLAGIGICVSEQIVRDSYDVRARHYGK